MGCSFAVVDNLAGNQGWREVVHTSEVPFRATIAANMRAWPASKALNLKEIIRRMVGQKTEGCRGGAKEHKKLFAKRGGHVHEPGIVAKHGVRTLKKRCGLHE